MLILLWFIFSVRGNTRITYNMLRLVIATARYVVWWRESIRTVRETVKDKMIKIDIV